MLEARNGRLPLLSFLKNSCDWRMTVRVLKKYPAPGTKGRTSREISPGGEDGSDPTRRGVRALSEEDTLDQFSRSASQYHVELLPKSRVDNAAPADEILEIG